jgi:4-amino-4-deoxy-L-arabinose transferase-like glycosyltransferase
MPARDLETKAKFFSQLPGPLGAILALYVILALIYSASVPIFEAPDEPAHFLYANDLAEGDGLPVLDYAMSPREYHQPPLYYWLVAGVLRWFNTNGYKDHTVRNPHAAISDASTPGNKNAYLHDPDSDGWPYTGFSLAIHVGRLVSIALGTITVWATYKLARQLFSPSHTPESRGADRPGSSQLGLALAAASVVAFNPQFLFISSALNNDNAVTAISSLALLAVVTYYGRPRSLGWVLGLGALGGLAMLTKTTGLAVLALIVVALIGKAIRQRLYARLWLDVGLVIFVAALIGGWWYIRNALLYDDPFLSRYMQRWLTNEGAPRTAIGILHRFQQGEVSFWGTFGWLSITWDEWIYTILRIWTRLSGLGLLVLAVRWLLHWSRLKIGARPHVAGPPFLLVLVWTASVAALLVQWILVAGGLQGRLLFPAISALAVLLIAGWTSLVPRRWRVFTAAVPALGLAGLAITTPFTTLAPAYARPAVLASADLPADVHPVDLNYAGQVKLMGYQVTPSVAQPGQPVAVTLYWQVLEPITENFSLFIHLFGRDRQRIGTIDTYPGLGSLPTSQWKPGQEIRDVYPLRIAPDAAAPTLVTISVGWYDFYGSREGIHALDALGQPTTTAGTFKLIPHAWPEPEAPHQLAANFDNLITLAGYDAQIEPAQIGPSQDGEEVSPGPYVNLTFVWQCNARPAADYTVFAHLLDGKGNIVAQMDRPPLNGDYPTSAWETGEVITDSMTVPMPPEELLKDTLSSGQLWLRVGLYRPEDGTRLPVRDAEGQVISDAVAVPDPLRWP